jgi:sugar lactone lactonase YvrE
MAVCSVLVDDGNLCGESPLWNPVDESLLWTDSGAGKFYRYDWASKRREILLDDFEVNGCALDHSGGLILVNNSGIWSWNKRDRPQLIADTAENEKLQLNDCIADPSGRLLAGSCYYSSLGQYQLGTLLSVEQDGEIRILDEGFHLANGLGFSPDGAILYFADSIQRAIYEYAYDRVTGCARDRRVFVELDRNSGIPDGLTVDAEGFVWSAEWYGGRISRYDPDGTLERQISIPAKQTSSLNFGGSDLHDIFITSASRSEPTPVMPDGYDPESGYLGGALFHINLGIQGKAESRTRIKFPAE